jgi:YidC/Oxa1 family membrane protein insertase
MDRNTIVGLLIIFALFVGFSIWTRPSEEELQKQREKYTQDSM